MQITLISDWENDGGANIAAVRISEGFSALGNEVSRIYQKATLDGPWKTTLIPSQLDTSGMSNARRLRLRLLPEEIKRARNESFAEVTLRRILDDQKPDIISLHNLHIARWSPELLRICSESAPTVCTLHDTWTFTGRCYNPGSCTKYLSKCDSLCPTAHEYPSLKPSQISREFENRRSILSECQNLAAVVPSNWLGRLATSGLWKNREVFQIPYPIDLECYKPIGREKAKEILGIDRGLPVLLGCAADLSNQKKGMHHLLDAVDKCGPLQLVLMGVPITLPRMEGVQTLQLGYVSSDRLKAIVYNAADLYIHPSLADNSPLTVIESLSCGTPVVSFPIDGLPELVLTGQTGWLAEDVSTAYLGDAIAFALNEIRDGKTLREECRAFAETRFKSTEVAKNYQRVFDHLLSGVEVKDLCFKAA